LGFVAFASLEIGALAFVGAGLSGWVGTKRGLTQWWVGMGLWVLTSYR